MFKLKNAVGHGASEKGKMKTGTSLVKKIAKESGTVTACSGFSPQMLSLNGREISKNGVKFDIPSNIQVILSEGFQNEGKISRTKTEQ